MGRVDPVIWHAQRALDIILSGVRWKMCLVYIDDIIVFSKNYEEHIVHLEHVLYLLKDAGIKLKLKNASSSAMRLSTSVTLSGQARCAFPESPRSPERSRRQSFSRRSRR